MLLSIESPPSSLNSISPLKRVKPKESSDFPDDWLDDELLEDDRFESDAIDLLDE